MFSRLQSIMWLIYDWNYSCRNYYRYEINVWSGDWIYSAKYIHTLMEKCYGKILDFMIIVK